MCSGSSCIGDELYEKVAELRWADRIIGDGPESVCLCSLGPEALLDQVLSPVLQHQRKVFYLEDAAVEPDHGEVVLSSRGEEL
jgi:hypothetical protein